MTGQPCQPIGACNIPDLSAIASGSHHQLSTRREVSKAHPKESQPQTTTTTTTTTTTATTPTTPTAAAAAAAAKVRDFGYVFQDVLRKHQSMELYIYVCCG